VAADQLAKIKEEKDKKAAALAEKQRFEAERLS
jgi:hypothetical protein